MEITTQQGAHESILLQSYAFSGSCFTLGATNLLNGFQIDSISFHPEGIHHFLACKIMSCGINYISVHCSCQ